MSATLEVRRLDRNFPFCLFSNDGLTLVGHHWHKLVEIIYVQKGTLKIGVNDELLQLEEGEFYIINSGDIHYFLSSPNSMRLVVQFDFTIFDDVQFLKKNNMELIELFNCIQKSSVLWNLEIKQKMITYLKELESEYIDKKEGYELAIRARLYDILLLIYRDLPHTENNKLNYPNRKASLLKLEKIFRYIEENYMNDLTLNDVANYIGFTNSYFAKFFKKYTGSTFCHFVNQYRITKAQWYLFNEDLPITEIAYNVGFINVKTFNRLFKNEVGLSPTQYKKKTIFEKF
ncbi:AraC family transcriptional regulator [Gottfriedia acidiceleris]|uniref:AraC family transcriptional regulator n=1 Tax=Gottfriedia acidiceleris TaxID=371036 RepID=UPI002F26A9B0